MKETSPTPEVVTARKAECHLPIDGQRDWLSSCVHCGFCLEACPTYRLTGDENNSPRGRLRLWREEAEGRLPIDPWTSFYTTECVGCLACESACPAKVPYGKILEHVRCEHTQAGRTRIKLGLRLAAVMAKHPRLMNLALWPIRFWRRRGLSGHRFLFPGRPSVQQSTAQYARNLVAQHHPTGPRVALLVGCAMESIFREINFATVRVLVENNLEVIVPENQSCCGAFQEHLGLPHVSDLRERNREAFLALNVDAVVCNSSGCGLALANTLQDRVRVCDVTTYLGETSIVARTRPAGDATRVYVDLPCHLVHGQKVQGIPRSVLDATGYRWELAPGARDCCGSGGAYNIQKPQNAQQILLKKSEFLKQAAGEPVVVGTANHVCMMQWYSARRLVGRDFKVRHIMQLLDPLDTW